MRQFHHVGLPTAEQHEGEEYVAATKVSVTDPRSHPQKIEFLRYESDSPVEGPLRELPHVAYRVDNLAAAMKGLTVVLGPFNPTPRLNVVFCEENGVVIELMEYETDDDLPWGYKP